MKGDRDDTASLLVELVRPNGEWVEVGLLHHVNETTWFESRPGYWDVGDRPVLGQVFEDRGPAWRPSARVALPNWFSHLLPEGRLRDAIAAAAHVKPQREFFLLSHIGGDDLPGALRVRSIDAEVGGCVPYPSGESTLYHEESYDALKFSLAGVQLKFSVNVDQERGITLPAAGDAGHWIVKLPDRRPGFAGVPEAEFAAMEFARACGIEIPLLRLVDVRNIQRLPSWAGEGGGKALLVSRFDRKADGGRVHAEELAQVLDLPTGHWKFKYRTNIETVARVSAALCGHEAVDIVIDRTVVNVLVGNGDAHAKNWAFVYDDGRRASLSPAYDIVPTTIYQPAEDLGLRINGTRDFGRVTLGSFERLAFKAGLDSRAGRERARSAIARALGVWHVLGELLPAKAFAALTRRRDALPLVREFLTSE